jgi:hypothetical protein
LPVRRLVSATVLALALAGSCASDRTVRSLVEAATTTTARTDSVTPATTQTRQLDVEHANASTAEMLTSLDRLAVADRVRAGYQRGHFGTGWRKDGECTVRERVLIAESLATVAVTANCNIVSGEWRDWYSVGSPTITDPTKVEIDHLVPLAHAWQAGAWAWTVDQRIAYANDLVHPTTLTAVSADMNRQKSSAPPDAWQPPNKDARCQYAKDWITTKTAWSLAVTEPERTALRRMLDSCV